MNIRHLLALLILPWFCCIAKADQPAPEVPWVKSFVDGRYIFKMVPAKRRYDERAHRTVVEREAFGVAYEINATGDLVEQWRTEGWYAFEVHLHDDGRHLVRMGLWASDQENHTDVAIAFYDRGKLRKEYRVKDLIKDPETLEYSVSHYRWNPEKQSEPKGFIENQFHLVMIDKTSYTFDIKNGEILSTGLDSKALSSREIRELEKASEESKGLSLYEASSFRGDFEKAFTTTRVEAAQGKIYGVYFEEPEWRAHLNPKTPLQHPTEIHAVFPIVEEQIKVSVTSEQILGALKKAFLHPLIASRFSKSKATGLRLRITGDRLHWNTPELRKHLKTLTGEEARDATLSGWAEMILDSQERNYFSFYLNTSTGELIHEDRSKWPRVPLMVDAKGDTLSPIKK